MELTTYWTMCKLPNHVAPAHLYIHMIRRLASLPLKNGPGRLACQVAEDEPSVTPKSDDDTGTSHSVEVVLQAEGKATRQRGGCDEGVTCMYVNGWQRQT